MYGYDVKKFMHEYHKFNKSGLQNELFEKKKCALKHVSLVSSKQNFLLSLKSEC